MSQWTKRTGIMLCYPFERDRLEGDRRIAWNSWPVLTQPKLDGERCRVVINHEGEVLLLSSEENLILGVPHVLKAFQGLGLRNIEFDGELYRHGLMFEQIHSIVSRKKNLHPDHWLMQFHAFDVIGNGPQVARTIQLQRLLPTHHDVIAVVPVRQANNFDEVMHHYDSYVVEGYEGIIVRHLDGEYVRRRSPHILKFKPKQEDVYTIIGVEEEISKDGVPKGTLGALVCAGDDGTPFNVGTGFTEEARRILWAIKDQLVGRYAKVQYQHLTSAEGVPRFPVFTSVWSHPDGEITSDPSFPNDGPAFMERDKSRE